MIRLIVLLILLGLVGYNTWEIGRLRADFNALQARTKGEVSPPATGPLADLAEAQKHSERAQEALRRHDFAGAQAEMNRAAVLAKRGSAGLKAQGDAAASGVAQTGRALSDQTRDLSARAGALIQTGKEVAARVNSVGASSEKGKAADAPKGKSNE